MLRNCHCVTDPIISPASKSTVLVDSFRAPLERVSAGGNRWLITFSRGDFSRLCYFRDKSGMPRRGAREWRFDSITGVVASHRSTADTAASNRDRRSIRTRTTFRRVCPARRRDTTAWASIPGSRRSKPAARRDRAHGAATRQTPPAKSQMPITVCRGVQTVPPT